MVQAMTIYAQTQSLLSSIESTTRVTQEALVAQNKTIVNSLLLRVRESAEKAEKAAGPADPTTTALVNQLESLLAGHDAQELPQQTTFEHPFRDTFMIKVAAAPNQCQNPDRPYQLADRSRGRRTRR